MICWRLFSILLQTCSSNNHFHVPSTSLRQQFKSNIVYNWPPTYKSTIANSSIERIFFFQMKSRLIYILCSKCEFLKLESSEGINTLDI